MKRIMLAFAVAALLSGTVLGRQWTSRSGGFTVEAELLDVRDGNAILKKSDGTELTVSLSKLSLGDLRYVDEVLKSAETHVTGKPDPGSAAKPDVSSATPAMAPAKAVPAADLARLRYAWKQGQTYVYRVKVTVDRGDTTADLSGDLSYKVNSASDDGFELGVSGDLKRSDEKDMAKVIFLHGGPRVRRFASPDTPKQQTITADAQGRVSRIDGSSQLPYLLGDSAQMILEPLPSTAKSAWTSAGDTGVSVIVTFYPFHRFYPFSRAEYHEGTDATEKTSYTVESVTDKLITVAKHYELATTSLISGKPRIEATGNGTWKFDVQRGVPSSLDFSMRVTARERNNTEEIPLRVTYRLITEEELAKIAKDAEEAKREKERPLTDKEIGDVVRELNSGDRERVIRSGKSLADRSPMKPSPEVAKALESVLLTHGDAGAREWAAKALTKWAVPESIPTIAKALNDSWPPVRIAALEVVAKNKPELYIPAIAQRLSDGFTRHTASGILKSIGAPAEDAVLAYASTPDKGVLREAFDVLAVIGTKKSLPVLEKSLDDKDWWVKDAAQKAMDAIKVRAQMPPAVK